MMEYRYTLQLKLLSPALIGSGVGSGSTIDADVVFDDVGIPFIPAKRIKGCLRDSAREINEMFLISGMDCIELDIEETFGNPGMQQSAPVYFSNLYIENYEINKEWLRHYLNEENFNLITRERIQKYFSEIRQQTKIGYDGVAFEHSLRTSRVLRKGIIFHGIVYLRDENESILNTLLLACLNFHSFGTNRNRGFGEICCTLLREGQILSPREKLEALCID